MSSTSTATSKMNVDAPGSPAESCSVVRGGLRPMLQNNANRAYDPTVGRWLSEDPLGLFAGDVNVSRYVGNAPLLHIDPLGLKELVGWDHWDTKNWRREGDILTSGVSVNGLPIWGDNADGRPQTKEMITDRFKISFQFTFRTGYVQGQDEEGQPISHRPGFFANSGIYIYNSVEVQIVDTNFVLANDISVDAKGNVHGWWDKAKGGKADHISRLLTGIPYGSALMLDAQGNVQSLTDLSRFGKDDKAGERRLEFFREMNPLRSWNEWNDMVIFGDPCFNRDSDPDLDYIGLKIVVNGRTTYDSMVMEKTGSGTSFADIDAFYVYLQNHHGSQVQFRKMRITTTPRGEGQ